MSLMFRRMTLLTFKEFYRDFLGMFFSFAFPLMFLVIFSVSGQPRPVQPMVVGLVQTGSGDAIEQWRRTLTRQPTLDVRGMSAEEAEKALATGSTAGVIYARPSPSGVEVTVAQRPPANPYLREAVDNAGLRGLPGAATVQTEVRLAEGTGSNMFQYVIPALLGMALLQLGLFGTATPVINARARGTLLHLAMTPMPRWVIVGAQVSLRLVIAAVQVLLLLAVAVGAFGLRIEGSVAGVLVVHALGALMLISMGIFLAGIAPSQSAGSYIVLLLNFAMLALGDIFFATDTFSALGLVSMLMPITYLADASRQLISGIDGRFSLFTDIAAMAVLSAVFLTLSVRTFNFGMKKE